MSARISRVETKSLSLFGSGKGVSREEYFCVRIKVANRHKGRRFRYQTWGGASVVTDEHGNT
jgi:hypothetical protein